ncbi:hypothetical protein S1OALGB6SA_807 [Olavius algarvensis spirochete endosymbiont]|nr:hypothetical protein S1OALGB6SA_807 [Olavius algarvensis spirochete endosymbiont]
MGSRCCILYAIKYYGKTQSSSVHGDEIPGLFGSQSIWIRSYLAYE